MQYLVVEIVFFEFEDYYVCWNILSLVDIDLVIMGIVFFQLVLWFQFSLIEICQLMFFCRNMGFELFYGEVIGQVIEFVYLWLGCIVFGMFMGFIVLFMILVFVVMLNY